MPDTEQQLDDSQMKKMIINKGRKEGILKRDIKTEFRVEKES